MAHPRSSDANPFQHPIALELGGCTDPEDSADEDVFDRIELVTPSEEAARRISAALLLKDL